MKRGANSPLLINFIGQHEMITLFVFALEFVLKVFSFIVKLSLFVVMPKQTQMQSNHLEVLKHKERLISEANKVRMQQERKERYSSFEWHNQVK